MRNKDAVLRERRVYHFDRLEISKEIIDAKEVVREQLQEIDERSGYVFNLPLATLHGLAEVVGELQQLVATVKQAQAAQGENPDKVQEILDDPEIADDIRDLQDLAQQAQDMLQDLAKEQNLAKAASKDPATPKASASEAAYSLTLYDQIQDGVPTVDLPGNGANPGTADKGFTPSRFQTEAGRQAMVRLAEISENFQNYAAKHPKSSKVIADLMNATGMVAGLYNAWQGAKIGAQVAPGGLLGKAAGAFLGAFAGFYVE